MKVTERRIVKQEWHETDDTKTGWESTGWAFIEDYWLTDFYVVEILLSDKYGHPVMGIAERVIEV